MRRQEEVTASQYLSDIVAYAVHRLGEVLKWQTGKHLQAPYDSQAGTISDVESLVSRIENKIDLTSKMIPISNGYAAVDSEYELLRAIRRRAEWKYWWTGLLDVYLGAQKTYSEIRRELPKLGTKRWREFCSSWTPLALQPNLWNVLRYFSGPVTQQQPFRTLAFANKVPETTIPNEFYQIMLCHGNTAVFQNSAAEV